MEINNSCIVYITDGNPMFVRFANNAVRYARWFCPEVPVRVLTYGRVDELEVDGVVDVTPFCNSVIPGIHRRFGGKRKRFPGVTFLKLAVHLIPELDAFDRIVVLDPDSVMLRPGIGELGGVDLSGNPFGACRSPELWRRRTQYCGRRIKNSVYFEGGLLVADCQMLRNDETCRKALADALQMTESANLRFAEQDLINLFFRITEVPERYNTSRDLPPDPADPAYRTVRDTCVNLHIGGTRKHPILDRMCKTLPPPSDGLPRTEENMETVRDRVFRFVSGEGVA